MKTASKTKKTLALFVGVVVSALAIFGGEFSTHGESMHEAPYELNIDEQALIERAIEELTAEEFVVEEIALKTIKVFDEQNKLIEQVSLWEDQEVEDPYTLQLLNQATFLSGYSNTEIYQVHE